MLFYYLRRKRRVRRRAVQGVEKLFLKKGKSITNIRKTILFFGSKISNICIPERIFSNKTFPISKSMEVEISDGVFFSDNIIFFVCSIPEYIGFIEFEIQSYLRINWDLFFALFIHFQHFSFYSKICIYFVLQT